MSSSLYTGGCAILYTKGTVSVIKPPCKHGNARFTMGPFKAMNEMSVFLSFLKLTFSNKVSIL